MGYETCPNMPSACGPCQLVRVPPEVCQLTMQLIREGAKTGSFKHVDMEEEGSLRKLDHGLLGEGAQACPDGSAPQPHMLPKEGQYFLDYRYDSKVVDEVTHSTAALRRLFGSADAPHAQANFRMTLDNSELLRKLREACLPSALRIFGMEDNSEAHRLSAIYLLYATLNLPGQIINLHLDVPEFKGLDRSSCPNWLLSAAHCSGLYADRRVRNVTCVFYPDTASGGRLAIYPSINGEGGANAEGAVIIDVEPGTVACMDADSCFHHSEQCRHAAVSEPEEVSPPEFPGRCTLEAVQESGVFVWIVRDAMTGREVSRHLEADVRVSVSCKFHMFQDQAEADDYFSCQKKGIESDAQKRISAAKLVSALGEDLRAKGRLPPGCEPSAMPLHKLGPLMVHEYVTPKAPTVSTIEKLWLRGPALQVASTTIIMDGSTGRQLIKNGMPDDDVFKQVWSAKALVEKEYHSLVVATHRSYIDAGSSVVTTNSYAVQPSNYRRLYPDNWKTMMLCHAELAAKLAVQARRESGNDDIRVLGCLPPLCESHRPDLFSAFLEAEGEDFCIQTYRCLAEAMLKGGADAFLAETMSSWEEASCAVRGCMNLGLPVLLSMEGALRDKNLRPQPQTAPVVARRALELKRQGVRLECFGFNCTEPETILECLKAIEAEPGLPGELRAASIPLLAYANLNDRKAVHAKGFNITKDTAKVELRTDLVDDNYSGYINLVDSFVKHGVTMVGGCCGCGPGGIRRMVQRFGPSPPMRVGFVGGGAVGMYLGAFLARAGHQVTIIDGWPENVKKIRSDGIHVEPPSCDRPFTQQQNLRALHIHDLHKLKQGTEFDIGIVAVKGWDTRWAAAMIDRYVKPTLAGGYVVSAQNGWPDEEVAAVVGRDRAVGLVMSFFSVAAWEPGHVERGGEQTMRMKGYTTFRPGEFAPGPPTPRVVALARMLDVVDKAEATSNLWQERWTKLSLNCIMNAPQAVSGLGYQEVASTASGRRVMILAASEACAVGIAQGHEVGLIHGRPAAEWAAAREDQATFDALDAYLTPKQPFITFAEDNSSVPAWQRRGTKRNWKVSMPQDVAKRRATEVNFLNGHVATAGASTGVSTPVNDALTAAVERITAGSLVPNAENLGIICSDEMAACK